MDPRRFASRMTNWDKKIRRTYPTDFYIAVRTLITFHSRIAASAATELTSNVPTHPKHPKHPNFSLLPFVPVGYHRHIYKCIREIKGALKIFSKATSKQESSKSEYFFKEIPARWHGIIKKSREKREI